MPRATACSRPPPLSSLEKMSLKLLLCCRPRLIASSPAPARAQLPWRCSLLLYKLPRASSLPRLLHVLVPPASSSLLALLLVQ